MFLTKVLLITLLRINPSSAQSTVESLQSELATLKSEITTLKANHSTELATLKTKYVTQENELQKVKRQISLTTAYCSMLSKEICGPCNCIDDYELQQRYYCDCQILKPKRDCLEFYQTGVRINGIYKVTMNNLKLTQVFCDQVTDGGGWTVFQRRIDGTVNFYRNWDSYKHGFGKYQHEFWLGNDNLHIQTLHALYPKGSQLRIDMKDWKGNKLYAKYGHFQVNNERTQYTLHLSGYSSGNAGDSFSAHSGRKFSTYDRDNDVVSSSCSRSHRAGWWYGNCYHSNLNGEYLIFDQKQPGYARGIIWYKYKNNHYSLKFVEMKVRRNT